ncbi:MAG: aldo/keto reductase [Acidimicrobiales bacterium]
MNATTHQQTDRQRTLADRLPTRRLGADGPETGAVGLGVMGMSWAYATPATAAAREAEHVSTIHAALDAGINLLDTADLYGPFANEDLLGRAVRLPRPNTVDRRGAGDR